MRPVYMISGGITKFAKAHADKDFRLMVDTLFLSRLIGVEREDTHIGLKVNPKFRRKSTWSVRDVYFVKAE